MNKGAGPKQAGPGPGAGATSQTFELPPPPVHVFRCNVWIYIAFVHRILTTRNRYSTNLRENSSTTDSYICCGNTQFKDCCRNDSYQISFWGPTVSIRKWLVEHWRWCLEYLYCYWPHLAHTLQVHVPAKGAAVKILGIPPQEIAEQLQAIITVSHIMLLCLSFISCLDILHSHTELISELNFATHFFGSHRRTCICCWPCNNLKIYPASSVWNKKYPSRNFFQFSLGTTSFQSLLGSTLATKRILTMFFFATRAFCCSHACATLNLSLLLSLSLSLRASGFAFAFAFRPMLVLCTICPSLAFLDETTLDNKPSSEAKQRNSISNFQLVIFGVGKSVSRQCALLCVYIGSIRVPT